VLLRELQIKDVLLLGRVNENCFCCAISTIISTSILTAYSAAMKNIREGHESDFRVFKDYLGLANLVLPGKALSHYETQLEMVSDPFFENYSKQKITFEKMNSLDSWSDASSETSSTSRTDSDVFDNFLADFPPLSRSKSPTSITSESLSSLDSLLLNRKPTLTSRFVGKAENSRSKSTVCVFCRNNGESKEFYCSHTLKDNMGNTTCPVLRAYTCPLCKANGDNSHTIKYCPLYTPKQRVDNVIRLT